MINYQSAIDGNSFFGSIARSSSTFESLRSGQIDKMKFSRKRFQL